MNQCNSDKINVQKKPILNIIGQQKKGWMDDLTKKQMFEDDEGN